MNEASIRSRTAHARRRRAAYVAGGLALAILLPPAAARAVGILPMTNGLMTFFWTVCDSGFMTGPWPDVGTALNTGATLCPSGGGGIAISDNDVIAAQADLATCGASSTLTLEQDLGGGLTRQLTQSEWDAVVAGTGGVGRLLVGVTLVSAKIRGTEVWPNPPIPVTSTTTFDTLWSDEDGDGQLKGGTTVCAAPPVPVSSGVGRVGLLASLLAVAITCLLPWTSRKRAAD